MKYTMRRDSALDLSTLGKILMSYQTQQVPKLRKYYNYYKGKMAIASKQASDVGKPNSIVCVNYCRNIVNNYTGYLAGQPINYSSNDDITPIIDVLNYNDVRSEDTSLLTDALAYGKAVELVYIDEDAQTRFKTISPLEVVDVYDDTLNANLLYGVRFYRVDFMENQSEDYYVEVYDDRMIRKYRSAPGFSSFVLLDEQPHYFNQVPFSFFYLDNELDESIFAQVMNLNDAYNELLSGEVDSFTAFSDAYLILKGVTADEEDLVAMKRQRAFSIDADADVSYLTKNISDTQVENMLNRIEDKIYDISQCPNFDNDNFGTASGVAVRYRLLGFENRAGVIESQMKKVLQKRIELICSILYLKGGEDVWRDVDITFTRNLPTDLADVASTVNQFRGLVSDETLLAQIPFIDNVADEMERMATQHAANMSMYNFGSEVNADEETTDEE